jgi:hypothetical protein
MLPPLQVVQWMRQSPTLIGFLLGFPGLNGAPVLFLTQMFVGRDARGQPRVRVFEKRLNASRSRIHLREATSKKVDPSV